MSPKEGQIWKHKNIDKRVYIEGVVGSHVMIADKEDKKKSTSNIMKVNSFLSYYEIDKNFKTEEEVKEWLK